VESGFCCAMAAAAQEISAPNDHGQTVQTGVDAQADEGPLRPVWSHFGYNEPNFTYAKNGRKLLRKELPSQSVSLFWIRW
jgi:xylan 1,4-beta-xylosidase